MAVVKWLTVLSSGNARFTRKYILLGNVFRIPTCLCLGSYE